MPSSRHPVASFLALGSLLCAACEDREPASSGTIGVGYSLPEDLEDYERWIANADLPFPVRLDGRRPEAGGPVRTALAQAEALVENPDLLLVIGHAGSRETLAACGVYAEHGVPLISPEATSPRMADLCPEALSLVPLDDVQARRMAGLIAGDLGLERVVVYHAQDEYGVGLLELLRRELGDRSVRIAAAHPVSAEPRAGELLAQAALSEDRLDGVVLLGRRMHARAVLPAILRERPDLTFVLSDGTPPDDELRELLAPAGERCYALTYWHPSLPDEPSRRFVEAFRRERGRLPGAHEALRRDALGLALAALRAAGPEREDVARWLRGLGSAHPPYAGITGEISSDGGRRGYLVVRVLTDEIVD